MLQWSADDFADDEAGEAIARASESLNLAGLALFVLDAATLSCGAVAGNVIWSGFVQSYYPREMLGRVSTSVQFFNYGVIPAGAVVAGLLASHLGVRRALWSLVAVLLVSAGNSLHDMSSVA